MRVSFLFLFGIINISVFGQNDSIIENKLFRDNFKSFKIDAKILQSNLEKNNKTTDLSYLFYPKENKLPLSVDLNIKKYFQNPDDNKSILEVKRVENEDDVIVVKHFNGVNKTDKKLHAAQNLGTIYSNTKFIKIAYRDFGLEDGDRVKVYVDNQPVAANVALSNDYYNLHINLDLKGYHQIDIEALNQGIYGPNTAEFIVYDDHGNVIMHKAWDLTQGKIASLGIVRF